MRQGKTIVDLATELEAQMATKKDYVVKTPALEMSLLNTEVPRLHARGADELDWGVNNLAHSQIAERTGIPGAYYKRMLASWPALLVMNVNHWFKNQPESRMLRTMNGNVRAFLSDRYKPIDNFDVADTLLPVLSEAGAKVESCELTERRMYLKAVFPKIQGDVGKGDPVQAGLIISNSEVGCGSVDVRPLVYRLVCLNGLIVEDYRMKRHHVGRLFEGDGNFNMFSSETVQADNKAFFMKMRDVVKHVLTQEVFNGILSKIQEAAGVKIETHPEALVKEIGMRHQLNEREQGGILRHLIDGGDLSKWGLVNAVTRTSQDVEDYDRATELEVLGGNRLNIERSAWQSIAVDAKAAA